MDKTIIKTWETLKIGYTMQLKHENDIVFNENAFNDYKTSFENMYKNIIKDYMKEPEPNQKVRLDRHKVAAIVMISIVKSKAVTSKNNDSNTLFIGNYLLAVSVGLSFMQASLNDKLNKKGSKKVQKFFLPEPFACNTKYIDVLARNLYYTDTNPNWEFNPLELADKLFLFEYITLLKNDINLELLKEYH